MNAWMDCRRFLNRLLGVEVGHQNLLFSYFLATLAAEVKAAKEEGRYSEGVSDLPVSDIREPPPPQVLLSYDRYVDFSPYSCLCCILLVSSLNGTDVSQGRCR